MSTNPKTIQIFLPNGDPNGIKIATIRTRNIEVIYFSRNNLENLSKIMEKRNKVGIYFLIGFNEDKDQNEIYIGEAEDVIERLKQHNRNKDFWQNGYFVVDNNGLLTKSHIKYLENITYNKIKEAGKIVVNNETEPTKSYVDETIEADLNGDILETIKILLSLLIGDNIFEKIEKISNKKDGDIFICKNNKGCYAEGKYIKNGFLVFDGAKCNLQVTGSFNGGSESKMRNFLIDNKILIQKDNFYILQKDYLFKSPSMASSTILGMRSNGWLWWKNKNEKTLDEVYRRSLEK